MAQTEGSTAPNFNAFGGYDDTATLSSAAWPVLVLTAEEAVRLALVPPIDAPTKFIDTKDDSAAKALTTLFSWNQSDASRVSDFPSPPELPRRPTLHALQEWEGYVVQMNHKAFVAHLVDLTVGAAYAEEEVTIPLAEVSDDDAAKMQIGSIFRWVIGYSRLPSGTKETVSRIVFRDLPRMTKADIEEGEAWAQKIVEILDL